MKNILKTIALTATMVGMSGGIAFADSICSIENTGPGSDNTCTSTEVNDTQVSCVNNIYVVNNNDQDASSGSGTEESNTTGGSATTGTATNENGTTVQIGAACESAATTPTPPAAGGSGEAGTTSAPRVLGEATKAAQVAVKPVGGAGAGAGAGATSNKVAATTGILASAGMLAAGFALRKQAFGRN